MQTFCEIMVSKSRWKAVFLGIRRQRKTERAGCRVRAEKTSRLLDRRSFQGIRDFLMEYCDKPFVSGFEQMTPRLLPGYFVPYSDTYENDRRGSYMQRCTA